MGGFTLIIVLAFIGGLIAYFGDHIGMKVGRKRLTIFGLRPKHTSVIITVFTGIFITAASITILSIASDDVRTALFEMKEIQATLASNQKQLEQSMQIMDGMEESLRVIVMERDEAQADLNEALQQLETANDHFKELENRRAKLAEEFSTMLESFQRFENQIRLGNVVLQADEIFYSQALFGGRDKEEITDEVITFLQTADKIAYQLGARVDETTQAAIIIDQKAVDLAIHSIAREPQLFVLRVISLTNTIVGEPVYAYLELIHNDLIFPAGTVLAEITVDLDLSAATNTTVDKQILTLLSYVNMVAIKAGMITNNGGAVELSGEEFLAAIGEIQGLSGTVVIKALAAADTYPAVGPLKIELEIIPHS